MEILTDCFSDELVNANSKRRLCTKAGQQYYGLNSATARTVHQKFKKSLQTERVSCFRVIDLTGILNISLVLRKFAITEVHSA